MDQLGIFYNNLSNQLVYNEAGEMKNVEHFYELLLHVYTNSRSLYNCLVRINKTTEKRLLLELHTLRHSYECGEIIEAF